MPPAEVAKMSAEEFYNSEYVNDGRAKPERKSKNEHKNFNRLFEQTIEKKILI